MRPRGAGFSLTIETLAVHAGQEPDELTGAVSPPIYQTSTYRQAGVGRPIDDYDYARTKNPTRDRFERAVAALEGGGSASPSRRARRRPPRSPELADADSEIVVGDDVYGGTFRYLERGPPPGRRRAPLRRPRRGPRGDVGGAVEKTRLVWFETPTNPLLKVIDIAGRAEVLRERFGEAAPAAPRRRQHVRVAGAPAAPGARRGHRLPLGDEVPRGPQRHGPRRRRDARRGRRRPAAVPPERDGRRPGPFDCFLALRGLRTLPLRVARHNANASEVARFLAGRDDVEWLAYPGLASGAHAHPRAAAPPARCGRVAGWSRSCRRRRAAGSHGARARHRHLRVDPALHARRVAGRRRVADRVPA